MQLIRRSTREKSAPGVRKSWCDIHCHFLPEMDDGCKSAAESVELLTRCRKSAIAGMIATPHYYPDESIDRFLERRCESVHKLKKALVQAAESKAAKMAAKAQDNKGADNEISAKAVMSSMFPALSLGAEVAYYPGIVQEENLEKLCLGKSDYMLLELPFHRWDSRIMKDIYELTNVRGITPIIAHLERYLKIQKKEQIQELYESDAMIQMNGEYILDMFHSSDARRRIEKGKVDFLGSDTHNLTSRLPNLREAVSRLEGWGMEDDSERLRENNLNLFKASLGK